MQQDNDRYRINCTAMFALIESVHFRSLSIQARHSIELDTAGSGRFAINLFCFAGLFGTVQQVPA